MNLTIVADINCVIRTCHCGTPGSNSMQELNMATSIARYRKLVQTRTLLVI